MPTIMEGTRPLRGQVPSIIVGIGPGALHIIIF